VLHNLLLSRPEFWAALFGALAAFLLGTLGTWWAATTSKRTAANLTILTLSQMCGLMENLRHHLFVREPNRFRAITGRAPMSFQLRTLFGLPDRVGTIPVDQLGYLADSHDPDVMSRLLTVERAFNTMLDLTRTLSRLQAELTERISRLDPGGPEPMQLGELLAAIGPKPFIEIDDLVAELKSGLPQTRDDLLAVGEQLRRTVRMQFPLRHFIGFSRTPRAASIGTPPHLDAPAWWRRALRWSIDALRRPRRLPWATVRPPPPAAAAEPEPPEVRRFPPRSYDPAAPAPATSPDAEFGP